MMAALVAILLVTPPSTPSVAAAATAPTPGQKVVLKGVLRDLQTGKSVDVSSLGRKRTFIYIWATWCGFCESKIGEMNAIFSHVRNRSDVAFVSVCSDNGFQGAEPGSFVTVQAARDYVRAKGIQYPVLFDNERTRLAASLGTESFPDLFLIDETGTVVETYYSVEDYRSFVSRLREFLSIPEAPVSGSVPSQAPDHR